MCQHALRAAIISANAADNESDSRRHRCLNLEALHRSIRPGNCNINGLDAIRGPAHSKGEFCVGKHPG